MWSLVAHLVPCRVYAVCTTHLRLPKVALSRRESVLFLASFRLFNLLWYSLFLFTEKHHLLLTFYKLYSQLHFRRIFLGLSPFTTSSAKYIPSIFDKLLVGYSSRMFPTNNYWLPKAVTSFLVWLAFAAVNPFHALITRQKRLVCGALC
jgi:hypothetical protein